jgi:hypothetical protein
MMPVENSTQFSSADNRKEEHGLPFTDFPHLAAAELAG